MKKQCKRRVRFATEPALTRMAANPEVEIAHRLAIQALRGGWADYQNCYRPLADCHGVLSIGVMRKKDNSLQGVLQASMVALLNIYDRYQKTKRMGATGDELKALEMLIDVAKDFWSRQTSASLEIAIYSLREVRKRQLAEGKEKLKKAA